MNCADKIIAKGTLRNLRNSKKKTLQKLNFKKITSRSFSASKLTKSLCQKSKKPSQDEKKIHETLTQKQTPHIRNKMLKSDSIQLRDAKKIT